MGLSIEFNNKKYECKGITGRVRLEQARLMDKLAEKNREKLEGSLANYILEECEFICKAFNNQFTVDEFLDYVPAENIELILYQISDYINKKSESNIKSIVKN